MKNLLNRLSVIVFLCIMIVYFYIAQDGQSFLNPAQLIENPASVDQYKPESFGLFKNQTSQCTIFYPLIEFGKLTIG